MLIVLKYGSLNLLEPSGPFQACNGIALTFAFTANSNLLFSLQMFYLIIPNISVVYSYPGHEGYYLSKQLNILFHYFICTEVALIRYFPG